MAQGNPPGPSQVFLNLFKNAAEAMSGSGGVIFVRASVEAGLVQLRFEDTGTGISPDDMSKLFQPFFTTKEAGEGTGLGLSMSRQIAQAHGGDLEVESQLGHGTTFILTLPVAAAGGSANAT